MLVRPKLRCTEKKWRGYQRLVFSTPSGDFVYYTEVITGTQDRRDYQVYMMKQLGDLID